MKCKVCGAESGKYPLCRGCNIKKEKGEIIKCEKCENWHYSNAICPKPDTTPISSPSAVDDENNYLYNAKKTLISKSEQAFFAVIKSSIPEGYSVFPQINLASFIDRTDDARFHNELFRNIDFLITDTEYSPKLIIEINDQTHLNKERKERDEKVQKICEEAGVPILKLWTTYGINPEYIKGRIDEILNKLPVSRVHHFDKTSTPDQRAETSDLRQTTKKQNGCYVATCVYGSYNCPEVWVLRRYRDFALKQRFWGRLFVKFYYALSPSLVKHFGNHNWFVNTCKYALDKLVINLSNKGYENTPYNDMT